MQEATIGEVMALLGLVPAAPAEAAAEVVALAARAVASPVQPVIESDPTAFPRAQT